MIAPEDFIAADGAVLTPPSLAGRLARPVRAALTSYADRSGVRLPLDVVAWLGALEVSGRLARTGVSGETVRVPPPDIVGTVSATEFARARGVSPQAVRARCRRGTLPAALVNGDWRIYPEEQS